MNVLPIVFSLLMIMAIFTYGRLQGFLTLRGIRSQYMMEMAEQSRARANEKQLDVYDSHHDSEEEESPDETDAISVDSGNLAENPLPEVKTRIKAESKLNFSLFVNEELRGKESEKFQGEHKILLNLMNQQYASKEPFKTYLEKRPNLFEDLLEEIMHQAREKSSQKGKEITQIKQIANLPIADEILQEVLGKMLKGSGLSEETKKGLTKEEIFLSEYPSLYDYIRTNKENINQISLWNLTDPLLNAVFENEAQVLEVKKVRKYLHNQLKRKDPISTKEAEDQFMLEIQKQIPITFPPHLFSFETSKTRPPK